MPAAGADGGTVAVGPVVAGAGVVAADVAGVEAITEPVGVVGVVGVVAEVAALAAGNASASVTPTAAAAGATRADLRMLPFTTRPGGETFPMVA